MGLNKVVGENRRKKIILAAPSTANDGNKCNDLEKVNISSIDFFCCIQQTQISCPQKNWIDIICQLIPPPPGTEVADCG